MTLNMTIVAPWGVWQCSDHRVIWLKRGKRVRTEDDSFKHIQLRCPDGAALVTYTGLGAIDDDLYVSDWARQVLRGQTRTVDQSLIRLREAATAELARPAANAGVVHTFLVGAFLQRRAWAVVISNQAIPYVSPVLDHFITGAIPVENKGVALVAGEGRDAISADDMVLLERVAQRRPKRPRNYSQLLAHIHRRAKHSKHQARRTISETCVTAFMPPHGDGVQAKIHWDPQGTLLPVVPDLFFGVDGTDVMRLSAERFQAIEAGQDIDTDYWKQRLEEAGRRSVEPGKP